MELPKEVTFFVWSVSLYLPTPEKWDSERSYVEKSYSPNRLHKGPYSPNRLHKENAKFADRG